MSDKIESIKVDLIAVPFAEVITNHPYLGQRSRLCTAIVRIRTANGIEGVGHFGTENNKQIIAVATVIEGLAERLVGMDALRRVEVIDRAWRLTSELMHEGFSNLVQSVLDVALWDVLGKHLGKPVADLLGKRRDSVPVYGSHGLHRNADAKKIEADARKMIDEGFRAGKLRLLGQSIKEDVERVRVLREIVGPDFGILTDCAWSMTPATAVRLSRELEQFDLIWLEDPIPEDDYTGLARIRAAEAVPVASGERITKLPQLEALLAAEAIDHLIIDLQHVGGITNLMKCATLAETRGLPISGHSGYELHLPALAAVKDVGYLEYFAHYKRLFLDPPALVDGRIQVSTAPGMGLAFDEAVVAKLALSR